MSINGVSLFAGANAYLNMNVIPDVIKNRLLELGINPKDVSSLQEAYSFINGEKGQYLAQLQSPVAEGENSKMGSQRSSLRDKAEALARKLGVTVEDDDTLDEIFENIQAAIYILLDEAKNRQDDALVELIKSFQHELDSLIEQQEGGSEVNNNTVYNILDAIAEQNKYALGLNN